MPLFSFNVSFFSHFHSVRQPPTSTPTYDRRQGQTSRCHPILFRRPHRIVGLTRSQVRMLCLCATGRAVVARMESGSIYSVTSEAVSLWPQPHHDIFPQTNICVDARDFKYECPICKKRFVRRYVDQDQGLFDPNPCSLHTDNRLQGCDDQTPCPSRKSTQKAA